MRDLVPHSRGGSMPCSMGDSMRSSMEDSIPLMGDSM